MSRLPDGWKSGKFSDFMVLQRGFDLPVNNRVGGVIPIIASNGLVGFHNQVAVEGPGVITGRSGTIGKVIYTEDSFWPLNTALFVRDFKGNLPIFVFYFLEHFDLSRFSSGSGVPTLNRNDVHPSKISFPPLEEQRQIAQILSTWDEAISLVQALIAALQRRKQGLMQRLLTGEVRFPGFDGEWEEVRLGEVGETYTGLSGKTKDDFGEGKPYIPYKNIFDNSAVDPSRLDRVMIDDDDNQNCVQYGDVFFTTSSETPDEVGMSSVLLQDLGECYLNSFCFGFRLHDFNKAIPHYLRYLLRSDIFRDQMYKLAQGVKSRNFCKNR